MAAGFFIIATMFMKETIAQARHDSGVAMERLGVLVLNLRGREWPEARVRRTVERLLHEISADPSVESVSASAGMPFGIPGGLQLALSSPGMSIGDHDQSYAAVGIAATPSMFKTLGIVMIRGRAFDERDQSGAASVVVISELTALEGLTQFPVPRLRCDCILLILNGEIAEWSMAHAWKAKLVERDQVAAKHLFADPIQRLALRTAPQCDSVNLHTARQFETHLTQFLHSPQANLFGYLTMFLGTLGSERASRLLSVS